jgi:hypothetical protein
MDQKKLKQRGIKIPYDKRMFFTPSKLKYSKEVTRINIWKKMGKVENAWASKTCLVTLLSGRNQTMDF